jgi:hypothetical protein
MLTSALVSDLSHTQMAANEEKSSEFVVSYGDSKQQPMRVLWKKSNLTMQTDRAAITAQWGKFLMEAGAALRTHSYTELVVDGTDVMMSFWENISAEQVAEHCTRGNLLPQMKAAKVKSEAMHVIRPVWPSSRQQRCILVGTSSFAAPAAAKK